jgi:hypothetical protein
MRRLVLPYLLAVHFRSTNSSHTQRAESLLVAMVTGYQANQRPHCASDGAWLDDIAPRMGGVIMKWHAQRDVVCSRSPSHSANFLASVA